MYLLQLFDWYAASISIILICLTEVGMAGWAYGMKNFVRDVEFMIGHKLERWWIICWKYITPFILTVGVFSLILMNATVSMLKTGLFFI